MSLCRFWWDYGNSDVYIWGYDGWVIETWNRKSDDTPLPPEWNMKRFFCETNEDAIKQLQKMIEAGFKIPDDVIPQIREWKEDG